MRHAVVVEPETDGIDAIKALQKAIEGGLFKEVADGYMKDVFIPALAQEYRNLIGPDHYPEYISEDGTSSTFGTMDKGFDDLFKRIETYTVTSSEDQVTANLGPHDEVTALRLSDYTRAGKPRRIDREPNTLFYAVEFGTGTAEKVGGAQFVRDEGPTKHREGRDRGAWWIGPHAGSGRFVMGQKGLHFLYAEQNRKPKTEWRDFVARSFPGYATQALKSKGFGGRSI